MARTVLFRIFSDGKLKFFIFFKFLYKQAFIVQQFRNNKIVKKSMNNRYLVYEVKFFMLSICTQH